MNHFKLIRLGLVTEGLLRELSTISHALTLTEDRFAAAPVAGIRLRASSAGAGDPSPCHYTDVSQRLPGVRRLLQEIGRTLAAELGVAGIEYHPPGFQRRIPAETGASLEQRYRLVLFSPRGSYLSSGGEEVRMRPGELWWYDHRVAQLELNDTAETTIHLVFELQRYAGAETGRAASIAVERL